MAHARFLSRPPAALPVPGLPPGPAARSPGRVRRGWEAVLASWPVRGYRAADAGHLVSIVASNPLIALVPTFLPRDDGGAVVTAAAQDWQTAEPTACSWDPAAARA